MGIDVFISYNIWLLKRWFKKTPKSMSRFSTWMQIYSGFLYGAMFLAFWFNNVGWLYFAFLVFGILLVMTIYIKYKSGMHIDWQRKQLMQRVIKQQQEKEAEEIVK